MKIGCRYTVYKESLNPRNIPELNIRPAICKTLKITIFSLHVAQ